MSSLKGINLERNIKITLEYDGTDFCGWQVQPNVRTVQEELEKALQQIFRKRIPVIGAGRTDSGVHARAQVANFRLDSSMPAKKIMAALNGNLPKDVRVLDAEETDPSFHSRFAAKKRIYRYYITRKEKAINRHYLWCYKNELDVEAMRHASQFLIGKIDFKSFCSENADLPHHFCTVEESHWEEDGDLLIYTVSANRFIHSMVRIIVGTMIEVGRGYTQADAIPDILAARDRKKAGPTAPAKGLILEKIIY
ncbi:tRNA pseudouridine(38-40) synthase TruA [candidate division KSB1 bacterium 4484_87]|nr:MAG: tRNA pseudouridine(38-40) synthase TruA [candidate division KSB1 bacterium 4484_87]